MNYDENDFFEYGEDLEITALDEPSKLNSSNLFKFFFNNHKNYAYDFQTNIFDDKDEIETKQYTKKEILQSIQKRFNKKNSHDYEVPHFQTKILEYFLREIGNDRGEKPFNLLKNTKVKINFSSLNEHLYKDAINECRIRGINPFGKYEWIDVNGEHSFDRAVDFYVDDDHRLDEDDFNFLFYNMFKKCKYITKALQNKEDNPLNNHYALLIDDPKFHGKVGIALYKYKCFYDKNGKFLYSKDVTDIGNEIPDFIDIRVSTAYKTTMSFKNDINLSRKHIDITDEIQNNTILGTIENNFENPTFEYYKNLFKYAFSEYCSANQLTWIDEFKNEYHKQINLTKIEKESGEINIKLNEDDVLE